MIQVDTTRLATHYCLHCGTERPYGSGPDEGYNPELNCGTCKTETRHAFKAVNDYRVTTRVAYDENRYLAALVKRGSPLAAIVAMEKTL